MNLNRRHFLKAAASAASIPATAADAQEPPSTSTPAAGKSYLPNRIVNDYSRFLPGEREALSQGISCRNFCNGTVLITAGKTTQTLAPGGTVHGWNLKAIFSMNGTPTAVLEKQATHAGAIVYVTEAEGVILRIRKGVGSLASIRPRGINTTGGPKFVRQAPYVPGPDTPGNYILLSNEDPCYENVAALGAEYIGYTFVGNEQAGPLRSLFLEADGKSRQLGTVPQGQTAWAPDLVGPLFDPSHHTPGDDPSVYRYLPGYSKRTLLGGYLPVANIGVWNEESHAGYEVMVLLPNGTDAQPIGRVRSVVPKWMVKSLRPGEHVTQEADGLLYIDRYWNALPEKFFYELAGIGNYWQHFFEDHMPVDIPDEWLLNAARAGITLSRCSYRGLEPTYQIGEGAYTKIPERSHALFPVAFYEFVWAHQLWNQTGDVERYVQNYLDKYILPDGNFVYNTQDQVEAPLNVGIFLWNSARSYDYTHNLEALKKRLPTLRRMLDYVLTRYEYSKANFPLDDPRYGLIWGSPEADLGEVNNDFPNSHPYYFQNAVWTWRGLKEHARCLELAARENKAADLQEEAKRISAIATEMRTLVEQSLEKTQAAQNPAMREAGITSFDPDDIHRMPRLLTSYENHRFMMDWFTADWGSRQLDLGHLKHREIAGQQIMGLHTDGDWSRTSNFMEHGTLAVKIRQEDYRSYLLTLYSLCCYAADSGNRYSPEDAFLPGSYPGEGSPYGWSSVVNSVLQPTLGLRWLLCYEESDRDLCHLQKAAPKHWFAAGEQIKVRRCSTRFGEIHWTTKSSESRWSVVIDTPNGFSGDLAIHIHPPDRRALKSTTAGKLHDNAVILPRDTLAGKQIIELTIS
jgi:hypothetical protein